MASTPVPAPPSPPPSTVLSGSPKSTLSTLTPADSPPTLSPLRSSMRYSGVFLKSPSSPAIGHMPLPPLPSSPPFMKRSPTLERISPPEPEESKSPDTTESRELKDSKNDTQTEVKKEKGFLAAVKNARRLSVAFSGTGKLKQPKPDKPEPENQEKEAQETKLQVQEKEAKDKEAKDSKKLKDKPKKDKKDKESKDAKDKERKLRTKSDAEVQPRSSSNSHDSVDEPELTRGRSLLLSSGRANSQTEFASSPGTLSRTSSVRTSSERDFNKKSSQQVENGQVEPETDGDINTESEGSGIQDVDGVQFIRGRHKEDPPIIKGATLPKLVETLTTSSYNDLNFLHQFLLTYRSFTTPHIFLGLLRTRFDRKLDEALDEAEKTALDKENQVIRLRVYNVLKTWVGKHWIDFEEDESLVSSLRSFVDQKITKEMGQKEGSQLARAINKNMDEGPAIVHMFSEDPPKTHPVPSKGVTLMEIHSEELARQMTLLDYRMLQAIKPVECLCWKTNQKESKSANLFSMVNRFNIMSKWVQSEILKGESPKQRAVIIYKFLEIMEYLRGLHNYNSLMVILSGLNASAIYRLRASWAELSARKLEIYEEMQKIMSSESNFKSLRARLKGTAPPCLPYVGMYLTDLTFLADGHPQYLPNGYINFEKCRRSSTVIQEIIKFQQTPYNLTPLDDVQRYLVNADYIRDDDMIYRMSMQIEERKG